MKLRKLPGADIINNWTPLLDWGEKIFPQFSRAYILDFLLAVEREGEILSFQLGPIDTKGDTLEAEILSLSEYGPIKVYASGRFEQGLYLTVQAPKPLMSQETRAAIVFQ